MADILIRGMEMPKEGGKILIAADGSVWVNAWPTRGYMRMENVYAVPLPEGHGRLGDLDALAERCDSPHWCVWLNEIQDAPTIVPAERDKDNG